jgi:hypothetical protein
MRQSRWTLLGRANLLRRPSRESFTFRPGSVWQPITVVARPGSDGSQTGHLPCNGRTSGPDNPRGNERASGALGSSRSPTFAPVLDRLPRAQSRMAAPHLFGRHLRRPRPHARTRRCLIAPGEVDGVSIALDHAAMTQTRTLLIPANTIVRHLIDTQPYYAPWPIADGSCPWHRIRNDARNSPVW